MNTFGIERIDILRGPSAMLYGGGSPGGLVNIISKTPTTQPNNYVETGVNSYGNAYFNFDYGTGRIRGLYLQGNEAAQPIFRDLPEPYKDLGASTLSISGVGATDHISFDEIGLPAFQWIRDYMEGDNTRAPHTNMDTYDHVLGDDLMQSAAVAAALIYHVAMRGERIPRKPLPSH